jgi:hypothetical protein
MTPKKNEISVFVLMQSMIGNGLDWLLGIAGEKIGKDYVQDCQTRALLYRQLAKHCNEEADYFDERIAKFATPSLVVAVEQPPPAAPAEEPPL